MESDAERIGRLELEVTVLREALGEIEIALRDFLMTCRQADLMKSAWIERRYELRNKAQKTE